MKTLFYLIIFVCAAAVAIFLAVLNPAEVDINLYIAKFRLPVSTVIIISMFFGVLVGFFVGTSAWLAKARQVRKLKKNLRDSQTELNKLRKQPIEEI